MRSPASCCSYWLGNSGGGPPLLRNDHRSLLNKKRLKNGRPAARSGACRNRAAQRPAKRATYGAGVIERLSNSSAWRPRTTRTGDSAVILGWADCRSSTGDETPIPAPIGLRCSARSADHHSRGPGIRAGRRVGWVLSADSGAPWPGPDLHLADLFDRRAYLRRKSLIGHLRTIGAGSIGRL
jgi:hypothetical protein